MSHAAKSMLAFGLYGIGLGLVLMVNPNLVLELFRIKPTQEVYLRLAGVLLVIHGFYDIQAARHELTIFFQWSVYAHVPIIIVFAVFVWLGLASRWLILFGAIDLLFSIWTSYALWSSKPPVAIRPA